MPGGLLVNRRARGGIRFVDGAYYVEVVRKSSGTGNTVEPFAGGWWHFAAPGSGMFLRAATPIMDYTCSRPEVGRYPEKLQYVRMGRFDAVCSRGWCVPAACNASSFDSCSNVSCMRLDQPAHWKSDPPPPAPGTKMAISWWGLHQKGTFLGWGTNGPKMVVDYRKTGVTRHSYANGTRHISCPPRHQYFVAREDGRMEPCDCDSAQRLLNCRQLRHLQAPSELDRARILAMFPNGSACIDSSLCPQSAPWDAKHLLWAKWAGNSVASKWVARSACDGRSAYMPWPPSKMTADRRIHDLRCSTTTRPLQSDPRIKL